MRQAILIFLDEEMRNGVSSEQVGMLKLLKLAMEMKKFEEKVEREGRKKYSVKEFYEEVYEPIQSL